MAKIAINSKTLTEVLDGAGFCYSESEIKYYFGANAAEAETAGEILLSPRTQINGIADKKIWAQTTGFSSGYVTAITE